MNQCVTRYRMLEARKNGNVALGYAQSGFEIIAERCEQFDTAFLHFTIDIIACGAAFELTLVDAQIR